MDRPQIGAGFQQVNRECVTQTIEILVAWNRCTAMMDEAVTAAKLVVNPPLCGHRRLLGSGLGSLSPGIPTMRAAGEGGGVLDRVFYGPVRVHPLLGPERPPH